MKRYLLCELDDEHYAEPEFYIYDSREGAFKDAVEDCINAADGGDFQMKVENNQNRISVNFDYEKFFVTEIKELDLDDGNYAIIRHHPANRADALLTCRSRGCASLPPPCLVPAR